MSTSKHEQRGVLKTAQVRLTVEYNCIVHAYHPVSVLHVLAVLDWLSKQRRTPCPRNRLNSRCSSMFFHGGISGDTGAQRVKNGN